MSIEVSISQLYGRFFQFGVKNTLSADQPLRRSFVLSRYNPLTLYARFRFFVVHSWYLPRVLLLVSYTHVTTRVFLVLSCVPVVILRTRM